MKYLYFEADGCCQCHALEPKFVEVCKSKGLDYEIVDAEFDERAISYGIRSVPYIVICDDTDWHSVVDRGIASEMMKKI